MKRCTKCNETKPDSEFHRKTATRLDSRCRQCKALYDRDRRAHTNAARRRTSAILKTNGICVRCGRNPTDPQISRHTCPECLLRSREADRTYRKNARDQLFSIYGGKVCACCGETEELFLTFDHINEDGAQHRLSIGKRSDGRGFSDAISLLRALRKQGFPNTIQVLCHNCNQGKHLNGGICPHQGVNQR